MTSYAGTNTPECEHPYLWSCTKEPSKSEQYSCPMQMSATRPGWIWRFARTLGNGTTQSEARLFFSWRIQEQPRQAGAQMTLSPRHWQATAVHSERCYFGS